MSVQALVVAHGLACPLGLSTDTALAAMRAGLRSFVESELVNDATGEPVRASMLEGRLPARASRTERALYHAQFALAQACRPLQNASGLARVPCFLALPSAESGPALELSAVVQRLGEVTREASGGLELELRADRVFPRGRAAVFVALQAAIEALERGDCRMALVGGLDSQVDPERLRALARDNRILGPCNRDGSIPGEGAAFVLLASTRAVAANPLARVIACSTGLEPHPRGHGGPNVAQGLTAVFAELHRHRGERVDVVISGQTGESGYERAFAYAYLRNAALMPEPLQMVSIGAKFGDAGAAAGAMALVTAVAGLRATARTLAPTPLYKSALCYAESEDGTVGGCILA